MAESQASLKKRGSQMFELLRSHYPDAKCSLHFRNPFELIVATVLSAQCTDARVNQVTPKLFEKYPDAPAMARAKKSELEALIHSTGFYRNKAASLLKLSQALVEQHSGEVPRDLEALTALRGVGRKTANVVLGTAFGIPGVVVDTHVGRLARRLGFSRNKDATKVEFDLMKVFPKENWTALNHLWIDHGRAICQARKPLCDDCFLSELCPRVDLA